MIGVISDVHANHVALQTVLDDMPDVDRVVCCGDIIGYGPSPRACVETVQEVADAVVYGNHEDRLLNGPLYNSADARQGLLRAKDDLYSKHFDWLESLSHHYVDDIVQMIHSHPVEGNHKHVYEEDIESMFEPYFERDIFLYGHTHIPVNQMFGDTLVVNPGSVGQPRDGDPRAGYAVIDEDELDADLHRVEYDVDKTVQQLHENNMTSRMDERLRTGR